MPSPVFLSSSSVSSLFGDLDVEVTPDAPIGATMTWYAIGGRADVLLRPRTLEALATLVKRCHRSGTPLRVPTATSMTTSATTPASLAASFNSRALGS